MTSACAFILSFCYLIIIFFFLLLKEPNIHFLQRLTISFIDHQHDLSWMPCLGHNMSIHLNISRSCSGAEPADILLYKSKKRQLRLGKKKNKKTFTNSLPAARIYDRAALSGLLFLSFSAVVVRRGVIILVASFLTQVRKKATYHSEMFSYAVQAYPCRCSDCSSGFLSGTKS